MGKRPSQSTYHCTGSVLTLEESAASSGADATSRNMNIFLRGLPCRFCLGPTLRGLTGSAQDGMAIDQLKALFYFVLVKRVDIWLKAFSCEMSKSCQFLS